jgi:hypothetical protein
MKTSLNELRNIEAYVLKEMSPQEQVLFEARMLLQPELHKNVAFQKQTYNLIRNYSRNKLKAEIEAAHQQLFSQPKYNRFREYIASLF